MLLILANVPLALYLSLLHQRAPVSAALHLGQQQHPALLLLPCHSTPLHSHLHLGPPARSLACRPPVPGLEEEDEAEAFHRAPRAWLEAEYPPGGPALPPNVLLFDSMEAAVSGWLRARGRGPCQDWHHTHFPTGRQGRRLLLYCGQPA
jgi:phosphatidylinositol glycan class B